MALVLAIDWNKLFGSGNTSPLELFVRGTFIYLGIFTLLRAILRRESASFSLPDLLMVVLLADAAQNGMAGEYNSITDAFILISTIIFWNYFLDRLAFYVPLIRRFVHPPPLPLIRNGRMLKRNMHVESISEDELMMRLRELNVEDIKEVKVAFLEGDGNISVVTHKQQH